MIGRATYLLIGRGFLCGSAGEQRLERRHGLLPPVVAKDEFVEIDLELIAAHTVISSDQPLLQVADRAVCQRHHGLCAFTKVDSQRLAARHVLEPSFLQPSEAFETVGVYRGIWRHVLFKECDQSAAFEIRDDRHASAPGGAAPFLYGNQDQRRSPALELPASPQTSLSTPNPRIINFYFAPQRLACQVDHSPPELVEHHPRRFITWQSKLTLQE